MKSNRTNRFLGFLGRFFSASAIVMSFFSMAQAATYQDANVLDTWNNTDANWDAGVVWTPGADAVFAGTGETVAVTTVTAHNITFDSAGYLLSGSTITLNGTTPTLTANADAAISSVVAGAAGLVKAGTGQLTLSGLNTYTGGTAVNAGNLKLDFTTRPIGGTTTNVGTINVGASGTLELFCNVGAIGTPTLFSTGSTFTGSGTIAKTGTGYADFWNGTQIGAFAGLIDVKAGFLSNQTTGTGAWSTSAGLMDLNIDAGAYVDLRTDGGIVVNKLTGGGTIGSSFSVGMVVTVGANNGSSTFAGTIQNTVPGFANAPTVNVLKTGTGTFTLSGTNTFTGYLKVKGGTVEIVPGATLGSIADANGITVGAGTAAATLNMSGGTVNIGGVGPWAGFNVGGDQLAGSAGTFIMSGGTINLTHPTNTGIVLGQTGATQWTQTGGTINMSGTLGGPSSFYTGNTSGAVTMDVSGGEINAAPVSFQFGQRITSTLNLSNAGKITFGKMQAIAGLANTSTINLGDGTNFSGGTNIADGGTSGILTIGTMTRSLGTLNFNFNGGTLKALVATTALMPAGLATTTVQDAGGVIDNSGYAVTIGQIFTHGGAAATDGGLIFKGTGTTTLTGVSSYNGPTVVAAGTLAMPEFTSTSSLAVADGATLRINGTTGNMIGGDLGIDSLTLGSTPGAGGATLVLGNFVSNPSNALINTAALTTQAAAGGVLIDLPGGMFTGLGDFPLIWYQGTIGGNGSAAFTLGSLPRSVTAELVNAPNDGLYLHVSGFNPLVWNGIVAGGVWDIDTTENWKGIDTAYLNGDAVVFDNTATGTTAVTLNTTVAPGSVGVANADYSITGTGAIAGSGGLTKSGTGTLTLGTNNTYTGLTQITGGTIKVGHANAFGSTAGSTSVAAGAVLDLNGLAMAAEPVTLNGTGIAAGGALLNSAVAAGSTAAPITLASDVSIGGTGNLTLSGVISGVGMTLTKVGANTVALSAANSYTGATTVNAGTLNLSYNNAANGTLGGGALNINPGATAVLTVTNALGYNGSANWTRTINIDGGSLITASTGDNGWGLTVNMKGGTMGTSVANGFFSMGEGLGVGNGATVHTIATTVPAVISADMKIRDNAGGSLLFDVEDGAAPIDLSFTGRILTQAAGGITKSGAGTMVMSGANTYAGPTTINGGTLSTTSVQGSSAYILADDTTLAITGVPGSSFSTGSLTLGTAGATTLNVSNFGGSLLPANAPVKVSTELALNGTTTVNVGGYFPPVGTYPVIAYPAAGLSGTGVFALGSLPRGVIATLEDNPTAKTIDLAISSLTPLNWNGNQGSGWNAANNWLLGGFPASFEDTDIVVLDDSATGTTAITLDTVVAPTSVAVNNSAKNYSIAGPGGIGGTGPLLKFGAGTLTLATANTYTGGTTVNAGTLQLGDGTTNGSIVGGITNNASVIINNPSDQTIAGVISGTGSLTKLGAGVLALSTAPTYTGPTTISAGTLQVPALTATSSILNNGTLAFNQVINAQVNAAGVISGSGSVAYTGPAVATSNLGQFLVDDANTYGGGTTVTNSRVNATVSGALGSGPVTVNSGGQVLVGTAGVVLANPFTINGLGWPEGAGTLGALRIYAGVTLTGPVTLGSNSRISVYSGAGTLTNVISGGTNTLEVTAQNNTQTLTLTGPAANTYTGATTVTSGQLVLAKTGGAVAVQGDLLMSNGTSPTISAMTDNQVSGNGLLAIAGTDAAGNSRFQLMGTSQTFVGISDGTSTSRNSVIQNSENTFGPLNYRTGTLVLNVADSFTYSGYLRNSTAGLLAITKNGLGTQTLKGDRVDYTGTTTVNAGTLSQIDTTAFVSPTVVASGGTLTLNRSVAGVASRNKIGGLITGTGTININNAVSGIAGGWTTFNSAANGLSNFTGTINVNSGVLSMDNVAGAWSGNPDVNVVAGGLFAIRAQDISIDALTGDGDVMNAHNSTKTLTVGAAGGSGTFSGVIHGNNTSAVDGTAENGFVNLVKAGAGNQTLTGVNTYAGTTTVSAGKLTVGATGSIDSTSSITIASGAQLDVTALSGFTTAKPVTGGRTSGSGNDLIGTLYTTGAVNVAGSAAVGTFTISGDLGLDGGGSVLLNLSSSAAAGNDRIVVGGGLELNGTTTVTPIFSGAPDTAAPYTLVSAASVTGDPATMLTSGLIPSRYGLAFATVGNAVQMTVTGTGKSLVWTGTPGADWVADATIPNAATQNWTADAVPENFQNLDSVTFDGTSAIGAVSLATAVTPATITVDSSTTAYTLTGVGSINGGGSLTKAGSSTLTLATTGTNTFSGGTTINGGVISIGNGANENATALGSGPVIINSTGTLWFKPGSSAAVFNFTSSFVLNGGTIIGEDGVQRLGTGAGATVTVGAAGGTVQATWGGKDVYLDGLLTGSGNLAVSHGPTAGSAATVHIGNPANTYNGTVSVGGTGLGMSLILDTTTALQFATVNLNPGTTAGTLVLGQPGTTTLAGLAGSLGTIRPAGAGNYLLNLANAAPVTYGGGIANNTGILGLTKTGAGSLTLSGATTFTGVTTLLAGTTYLTHSSALGGSTLDWNNNGGALDFGTLTAVSLGGLQGAQDLPLLNASAAPITLTVGAGNTNTLYSGVLSGTGANLIKTGTGALTLTGTNTYTGTTTVNAAGSLFLSANAPTVLGNLTMSGPNNTFLRTEKPNQFGPGVVASFPTAGGAWNRFEFFGKSQTLRGITTGNATTQGGGIFQNSESNGAAGAPATLTLNGDINADVNIYPVGGYVFNGHIRDYGNNTAATHPLSLVKTGSGTQTLVGNVIVYSGTTTVSGGTLVFSKNNAIRSVAINNSAIVEMNSVAGDDWIAVGNPVISGAGTWNKTGAGRATFNNATVTATGQFNIQAGTLRNNNNAGNWTGSTADIDISSGAILDLYADAIYVDQLTGSGIVQNNYGNATGQTGASANIEKLVVGVAGGSSTFSGTIRNNATNAALAAGDGKGGLELQKEGAGTLTLTGPLAGTPAVPTSANAFSGNITVNGGRLVGGAVGPVFGAASNARTITVNTGAVLEFQAPNTFGNHGGGNAPTLVINGGTVTNSDPLGSNKVNNGLRNVTLNSGTLTATVGNQLSLIDESATPVRPNEGYGAWGLNGTVTSTGNSLISSTATGMGGRILLNSSGNPTTMDVVSGTLTVSAPLQGGDGDAGGLTKTGPGTLVLSGVSIYKGPTAVNGGTLELAGSLVKADGATTTPSNVTVAAGATLKGTGTATGSLAVNGTVAPGGSIGTLAVGTTSFGFTGSLAAEINSTAKTADKLAITGDLNIDADAVLTLTDLAPIALTSAKLVLVTYTGAWNSVPFFGKADDSLVVVNGNSYTLNYDDTDGGLNAVTLTLGASDPFSAWASAYGLTGPAAAKSADPDGDGSNNLLEFATNSDPTQGGSVPRVYPLMQVIGADNALTYTLAVRKNAVFAAAANPDQKKQTATKDLVVYTVEGSNDLVTWNVVEVTEVTGATATAVQTALGGKLTAPPIGADWEWRTFRTDAGAPVDPSDLIRLKVMEAP